MRRKPNRVKATIPLLLPAAGFLFLFYVVPVLRFLVISVTEPAWGMANYTSIFSASLYWRVLLNTFEIAAIVTVLCLLLAYPVALLIGRLSGASRIMALMCVVV